MFNNPGVIDDYDLFRNDASGTLNNSGTLTIHPYYDEWGVYWPGQLVNAGTVNNTGTLRNLAVVRNTGTIVNRGSVLSEGTIEGSGFFRQLGGQTTAYGPMSQTEIRIAAGRLSADALRGLVIVESGGTLEVGTSTGTTTVDGNLASSGRLVFEIGGPRLGQFDRLEVDGYMLFVGGTLAFDFTGGYAGRAGAYWDFLDAHQFYGWPSLAFTFDGLRSGLDGRLLDVPGGKRLLLARAVPVAEPAPLALLAVALAGLALAGRRPRRSRPRA